MNKLLIVSSDVVDSSTAGPGTRAWELARTLSAHASVTLAVPNEPCSGISGVEVRNYDANKSLLKKLAQLADVILVHGFALHDFPVLLELDKPIVVDLYDPIVIENLEVHSSKSMLERHRVHSRDLGALIEQLSIGDFFICASECQRDYWLGALSAIGRINPYNYRQDKSLRGLVDVVPFGLPNDPPQMTLPTIRGVRPGIAADDRLVVWGGGAWAGLDPVTLIQAVATIRTELPKVRLLFTGTEHPGGDAAAGIGGRRYTEAVKASKDLGLLSRTVFFNGEPVDYEKRQDYLLEADVGVCLHHGSVEARYALRPCLLDYVWCGVPILCSRGDSWSELVENRALGRTVSKGDVRGVAEALKDMLLDSDLKNRLASRFAELADELRWGKAVQPLVDFLADPQRAADCQSGRRIPR